MSGGGEVRLVGRGRELEVVRDALSHAKDGALQAILIEGEAGIGKTRLIGEIIDHAREIGFTVFQTAADETERSRAFGLPLAVQASRELV